MSGRLPAPLTFSSKFPGINYSQESGITLDINGEGCAPASSFWSYLDQLVTACPLIIDRPRNSRHPCFPEVIYPLDYGYLEGTRTVDGGGLDVWLGTSRDHVLSAIILTIDLLKRDAEMKILLGCTEEEIQIILDFQRTKSMQALLVRRPILQGGDK